MARRRSPWHVERRSIDVRYAFFLSHVSEDADEVNALRAEIAGVSGRGGRPELTCFLDINNWEIGNDPGRIIRDYLLASEYLVAWVTPAYLEASRRGWIWYEFAYAELIELSLNSGAFGHERTYLLPIFRGVTIDQITRSPMLGYWSRQLLNPSKGFGIQEIARLLVDFYDQEARKRGPG